MRDARGDRSPLRVALIGFGAAGTYFHAPFIACAPGLQLAAVVTRDAGRAAQVRAEYPTAAVFESAGDIWKSADAFDLVVVAAPNRAHVPLATAAIEAGLPVVVDKPLAVTAAEARTVVDLARARRVPLTVFQNRRFDGDFLTLRALLAAGTLGAPLRLESRFERWRLAPKPGWRQSSAPEEGGGLLMDLGSHLIDQAVHLFGRPQSVYCELDRRRPGAEVDDDTFVALTHGNGVRSHLWMNVVAGQAAPRFRMLGSQGAYVKFGLDMQEDLLRSGQRPVNPEWGNEPAQNWGTVGATPDVRPVETNRGHYGLFYEAVASSLLAGTAMPVDPSDACVVLDVIEAARRSAAGRTVVDLG